METFMPPLKYNHLEPKGSFLFLKASLALYFDFQEDFIKLLRVYVPTCWSKIWYFYYFIDIKLGQ